MGMLKLVRPSWEHKKAYTSFYEEWRESGEDMVPWVIARDPYAYGDMLRFLEDGERPELAPPNFVSHSTYWLLDGAERVVGASNLRHSLNEKLLRSGGHIGYGIRPSDRGRGCASELLRLTLDRAHERGIGRVLVVCDRGNTASERVIVKNGGVFESEHTEENGNVVRRFWIGGA
ncbi:GCN5-like N-acetyltransferase [Paenibacillus mucilaginosus 3016]|uniref:GCN5-like N-acetyltransferase n=1 Tax=Paenibacillus mucilaginosus 3016 TaxID=1116391 RepID=H6NH24_9BACL|nr:GNAT family N-acetyltransferase [Paenibacillus mucilaginosus]AFC28702.1 GCN5-like N-acetyltransferase [Paenibacillus mucilaginosus 3016]WFA17479.1 GNAT family N-acetyltransferase [Paenibacillus mucilaginosus]